MTPANRMSRFRDVLSHLVSTYTLLILAGILFVVFSILLPTTFPTIFNIRSILGTQSITALLALAVMVPLAAGKFDLSVGYVLGLTEMLTIGLQVNSGLPWFVAIIIALAVGATAGLVSGLLVTFARIDSFIATLAVGTFLFGITNWYSSGQQIVGELSTDFTGIATQTFFQYVPMPAIIVGVVSLVLYLVLEYRPTGRRLFSLGANPRMAELVGVPTTRYVIGVFIVSGTLAGLAGAILASQLQAGQPDVGPGYLLPAFVGALLGATSVRVGRVNVGGTITAVALLAIGIAGLQQLGADFFVQPLFNGFTLAIAVGLSGYAARRRIVRGRADATHTTTRSTTEIPHPKERN